MNLSLALCATVITSAAISFGDDPGGPAKEIPELQALSRFVGEWDDQMSLKSTDGPGEPTEVKGTSSAEWVHGGRFLRQTWSHGAAGDLPAGSGETMMTYDPDAKVYRNWMFFSSGTVIESEGKWDPKTSTFTWTSREGRGPTTTTKATFPRDGWEQWSIVVADEEGKVVTEAAGTATRRDEKK